jgi:hypothetical protein
MIQDHDAAEVQTHSQFVNTLIRGHEGWSAFVSRLAANNHWEEQGVGHVHIVLQVLSSFLVQDDGYWIHVLRHDSSDPFLSSPITSARSFSRENGTLYK